MMKYLADINYMLPNEDLVYKRLNSTYRFVMNYRYHGIHNRYKSADGQSEYKISELAGQPDSKPNMAWKLVEKKGKQMSLGKDKPSIKVGMRVEGSKVQIKTGKGVIVVEESFEVDGARIQVREVVDMDEARLRGVVPKIVDHVGA